MFYRHGLRRLGTKGWARSACRWTCTNRRSSSTSLAFPYPTTILFLAGLFPEPNASAAGVRTKFLVEKLAQTKGVEAIHYATSAKAKSSTQSQEDLKALGVCFHHVPPNDSHLMEEFLIQAGCKTTSAEQPDNSNRNVLVIFDRFFAEEFYSQAIQHHCPHATMVLDMQDMHSLRWHRQAIAEGRDATQSDNNDKNDYDDSLSNLPVNDFPLAHEKKLQRELASLHRSDLSLVCSPVEMDVLQKRYQIPVSKLCMASFFLDDIPSTKNGTSSNARMLLDFHDRTDFVFIGGFKHDPNVDAVRQMHKLWPRIRAALDDRSVKLHVYGPFCPRRLLDECHDPSNGFYIHGETSKSLEDILARRRVMLAPIRFGAGIKGKIVDAWKFGTPVVTTPIGSEGIGTAVDDCGNQSDGTWGGFVARNSNEFVDGAVSLYLDETKWAQASQTGQTLLSDLYGIHHWDVVLAKLIEVCNNREARRELDYTRGVLWQQTLRSTEFFSRWIELKNRK